MYSSSSCILIDVTKLPNSESFSTFIIFSISSILLKSFSQSLFPGIICSIDVSYPCNSIFPSGFSFEISNMYPLLFMYPQASPTFNK